MTASKERILKICEYCGKSFYASKSTTRYCSKQCNSYAYKAARREEKVKMAETMSHRKASEKSMSEILVKEYLTIQEVAILLGLSRQTIYNMVYSGKLRASKITSRLSLIRKRDIDYLVDSLPYTTKKVLQKKLFMQTESYLFQNITLPRKLQKSTTFTRPPSMRLSRKSRFQEYPYKEEYIGTRKRWMIILHTCLQIQPSVNG